MTADPTTTLAAHPSVIDPATGVSYCCNLTCVSQGLRFERPIDHAAHQLAVLASEGWAIVKPAIGEREMLVGWSFGQGHNSVYVSDGDNRVYDQETGHTPAEAREIASWWLGAADAAEEVDL